MVGGREAVVFVGMDGLWPAVKGAQVALGHEVAEAVVGEDGFVAVVADGDASRQHVRHLLCGRC